MMYVTQEEDVAFVEGQEAAAQKQPRDDNPYTNIHERLAWFDGCDEEQDDA